MEKKNPEPDDGKSFERMRDLARRIVAVPKDAIDRKAKDLRRKKRRSR